MADARFIRSGLIVFGPWPDGNNKVLKDQINLREENIFVSKNLKWKHWNKAEIRNSRKENQKLLHLFFKLCFKLFPYSHLPKISLSIIFNLWNNIVINIILQLRKNSSTYLELINTLQHQNKIENVKILFGLFTFWA